MRFFHETGVLIKAADEAALKKKIAERIANLRQEIARGERMLANQAFVTRANPKVVAKEREKLAANRAELAKYRG